MDTADSTQAPDTPADDRPRPETSHAPANGSLHERVAAVYGPLAALYRLFDGRLRERAAADPAPVGWTPHIEALQALMDGRVRGDRDRLAGLMVDAAALAPGPSPDPDGPAGGATEGTLDPRDLEAVRAAVGTGHAHLIRAPAGTDSAAVVREIVRLRTAAGARTLLLVPTAEAAGRLVGRVLGGTDDGSVEDDPGIRTVRVEPREDTGRDDASPEGRIHTAVIRPVGTSHRRAWDAEIRRLRRELLWLEQWPRDRAALAAVQAEHERRRGDLSAGEDGINGQIRERRAVAAAAEQETVAVQETHDELGETHRRAAEEAAKSRAEWEELQQVADAAAQSADERTRTADASHARFRTLDERSARCAEELRAARRREESLIEELARAKAALPEAAAETERLSAAATQAAAVGHACYYRLTADESALAAEKRKLSLGQRMRITPAGPDVKRLQRKVAQQRKEADEAAANARRTGEALERAEAHHAKLAAFLAGGDDELTAVKTEQDRLAEELARVSAERDSALAEHREHAELVPEAVQRATEAAKAAQRARRLSAQAEERRNEALRAHEEAGAEADRARAEADTAAQRLAESETELERRREQGTTDTAAGLAEIAAATEAEASSRRHVQEICGKVPLTAAEDVLADRRSQAMTRIERLCGYVELLQDQSDADAAHADEYLGEETGKEPDAEPGEESEGLAATRTLLEVRDLPAAPDPLQAQALQAEPDSLRTQALPELPDLPAAPDPLETQALQAEPDSLRTQALPELPDLPADSGEEIVAAGEDTPGTTGDLDADRLDALGDVLLETADLVCGTALGVAASQMLATAEFDTLVVDDAGRITDGEFLIGAIRAHRWILIGDERRLPAGAAEDLEDHVHALGVLRIADESADADLDAAIDVMSSRRAAAGGGEPPRLAAVRAEAERLRAEGLWEARYRDAYDEALRLVEEPAPGGVADPERALVTAMTDGLAHSVFERCAAAAAAPSHRLATE